MTAIVRGTNMELGAITGQVPGDVVPVQKAVEEWLTQNYLELMPEEVTLSLRLCKSARFYKLAMRYVL